MSDRFCSFSRRLTRHIVFALALTLIVIYAGIFYLSDTTMNAMINNTFRNLLEVENQALRTLLNDVELSAKNSANKIETLIDSPEDLKRAVRESLEQNPKIKGYFLAFEPNYFPEKGRWFEPCAFRSNGKIEVKQMGSEAHDYLKSEWYQKGIKAEVGYWSDPYMDEEGAQEVVCTYVRPIADKNGQRAGVFCAIVSLDWLHQKLRELDEKININLMGLDRSQFMENGSSCFIIAHDGTYISHPNKDHIFKGNIFEDVKQSDGTLDGHLAREMVAGKTGYGEIIFKQKPTYIFYMPVQNTSWFMGFVVPKKVMMLHSWVISLLMLGIMVLGLLIVYWVCRFTIHRSTKPLQFLAQSADEVAQGNFNAPLPDLHHHDEILQLRNSFGNMQHSLIQYIEKLKTTVAEKASMESELSIANEIQMSMLPRSFPERNDVRIYGSLKPAKAVGGDLFDFFIRDGKLFFCIGDVMGKGVPAALLMTVTKSLFRTYSANDNRPEVIVTEINKSICENNDANMFATLFVGILDLKSGKLLYCSGGHEPPLLINDDVVRLPFVPAVPVGSFDDTIYKALEVVLEPNMILFLFTDGLHEAMNSHGEMFKKDNVQQVARQAIANGLLTPQSLIQQMSEAVESFVGEAEQSDDLTMLAIQRLASDTIRLKASAEEYPRMTAFLKSFADDAHLNSHKAAQLRLAVEETIGNIIDYSGAKEIILTATSNEDDLRVSMTDDGKPFNPTEFPDPDLNVPNEERQAGGLGIMYMRRMSDHMTYRREGNHNILKMVFIP